jgi:ribonuclease R
MPQRRTSRRTTAPGAHRTPRTVRSHDRRGAAATPSTHPLDEKILAVLRQRGKHGVSLRELPRAARLTPQETEALPERLEQLVHTGAVAQRQRGRQFVLGSMLGLVTGRLQAHPDGYAFLTPDSATEDDYYVPHSGVYPAMHGDRVVASVRHSKWGKREARVVDVVERAHERLVGTYHRGRHGGVLEPQENRITYGVRIAPGRAAGAQDGDVVVGRIIRYPSPAGDIETEVIAVLGPATDPRVETEAVIYRYDLPVVFPDDVLAEAATIPRHVPQHAIADRLDLRQRLIVTIDGENARDFDDAVGIESRENGFCLWVSIADVAHYVTAGSALDQEAFARGTSVYFPDRVIPMLPETLSNGICSLNPGVDRLTKTVLMDFDAHGQTTHTEFHNSVIRSAARLTYTDVKRVLVERDALTRERLGDIVPMLEVMERLCGHLRERRRARGSIDFDLPEAEVVLDLTGRPEAIARAERHIGHQLIEEFMLAANEAVARHLMRHKVPLLHRVHEPPDADHVSELSRFLATFGVHIATDPSAPSPRDFQRALEAVAGRPEERLINTVLLRAMKQARYAAEPLGHFGLATAVYTHFTSPIRRYPDLVIHRLLTDLLRAHRLGPEEREAWAARLPAIAMATSRRERVAMDAERTVVALKKVQFMQDKLGEEFAAFISGVQAFGFFVELQDYFVEGLVHIATLADDHYELLPRAHSLRGKRSGRTFRIGDAVTVRVVAADPQRQRIDFQLVSTPEIQVRKAHPVLTKERHQPKKRPWLNR